MTLPLRLRLSGKKLFLGCTLAASQLALGGVARANPTAEQALGLAPVQKDVDYDKPAAADVGKCTIEVEKIEGRVGWVVKDPQGTVIRRFIDTNGDNTVDQWSYYEGGLEVYRDLDTNANGKADQSRWLNTAGSRWGVDADENGVIDSWKQISAEEVSAEAVGAMAARDSARFQRLLLTTDELKSLGLGEKFAGVIGDKLAEASKKFTGLVNDNKFANVATKATKWINFSGTRPGIVPAGTEGTTKDLLVYENVAAMMEVDGKTSQVQIGTMLRIGDTWRLIDVPTPVTEDKEIAAGTLFFTPTISGGGGIGTPTGGPTAGDGDFAGIEEINKQIEQATAAGDGAKVASLKKQKVAKIESLIPGLKAKEDRVLWTRQLIDALAEGLSEQTNPEFLDELKRIEKKIAGGTEGELATYAQFSALRGDYIRQANGPEAAKNFQAIHEAWLKGLGDFVKANPKSPETAEALLHLAIDADFRDDEKQAVAHYTAITTNFPQSNDAKKAAGAINRLQSVGKALKLNGTTSDGKAFSLDAYYGKTIIVHYWDSQNPANVGELAMLKAAQAKYAKEGVTVVGVSLDRNKDALNAFLQQSRLPWITLWEEGGMDGRLANDMGILTVPTIMIVDKTGKVANRGLHITQLDAELGTLLRK